ncbi:TPA: hypothetical protein ACTW1J_005009 [Raoultella planticola]
MSVKPVAIQSLFSSLLTYSASVTTPTKISMAPEGIFESFLLTLAPVVTEHYFL